MYVKSIAVYNFRSHEEYMIDFSSGTTIITGKNGSGKTSLLEALYVALQGSSFRGSDNDILKHTTEWYRIELLFSGGLKRSIKFNPEKVSGKKQFTVNDKINYRLLQKDKYPVVLFEPEDLRLLSGSPTRRRQFIDRLISQVDPQYSQSLRKYDRALKQRNNLLKRPQTTSDELFVWNIALSEYGSYIISERVAFIEKINTRLSAIYNSIASSDDVISIHYSHTLIGDTKQKLLRDLTAHSEKDRLLGFTSVGPHRHDMIVNYNNSSAQTTASRGENRSIILALKFIEVELIESILDRKPIILLDDVFSELDSERQRGVILNNERQIVITTNTTEIDGIARVKLS